MIRVLMVVLAAVLMPAAASAIPAGGASPDTAGTSATTSPKTIAPGQRISFTVKGFPAGETVYIKIDDGNSCSQQSVHGACVVHQQKIPATGVVSGSFALPTDIAVGKHWLRFLASQAVMRDGEQIGSKGFTARGSSDFTVAASGASASAAAPASAAPPAGGTPSAAAGASVAPTAAVPAAGAAPTGNSGATVGAAPAATAAPAASGPVAATPSTTADATQAAGAQVATSQSVDQRFPWVGLAGFVGLLVLSFGATRLIVARRR